MLLDSMLIANTLNSNSKDSVTPESMPFQIVNLFKNEYLYPQKINLKLNPDQNKEGRFTMLRA